jgi:AcrR family transcriptional regulator
MAMSAGFQLPPRERLAAIAAAAIEVFGRLGYRGTGTAEVAAKAGMPAGSLVALP